MDEAAAVDLPEARGDADRDGPDLRHVLAGEAARREHQQQRHDGGDRSDRARLGELVAEVLISKATRLFSGLQLLIQHQLQA